MELIARALHRSDDWLIDGVFQPMLDRLGVTRPSQAAAVFYAGCGGALPAEIGFSFRDGTPMENLPSMAITMVAACSACWMSSRSMGASVGASNRHQPFAWLIRVVTAVLFAVEAGSSIWLAQNGMVAVEIGFFLVAQYLQGCRPPPARPRLSASLQTSG